MKNTISYINSLKDLSDFTGIHVNNKTFKEKTLKCRKCGNDMLHLEDTNIYICNGKTPDGKDCGNIYYKNIH